MSISTFSPPLRAKHTDGTRIFVLAITDEILFIVVKNEGEEKGKPFGVKPTSIIFEPFFWSELPPRELDDDPQDPEGL